MDKEKIIKKVLIKLAEREKFAFKFLDWLKDKFKIHIPSKEEAIKILKDIDKKDIEKAYKFIPKIKEEARTAFTLGGLKKWILILAALTVVAGGVLPANASDAFNTCDSAGGCMVRVQEYKTFGTVHKVKNLNKFIEEGDTIEEAEEKIYKLLETKPEQIGFSGRKDILKKVPIDKFKLYKDFDGKEEFRTVKELLSSKTIYVGSSAETFKF